MKKFKTCAIAFLIMACVACMSVGLVACGSSDEESDEKNENASTMSVALDKSDETLVLGSETKSGTVLYATVTGGEYDGEYEWDVDGAAVTIQPDGASCVVEAKETGSATVSVSAGESRASCEFEVVENTLSLSLDKSELSLALNDEGTVTVEAVYADGTVYEDFEYELSEEGIVSVTRRDSVLTVTSEDAEGEVTLTVTARDSLKEECVITVAEDSQSGGNEGQSSPTISSVVMATSHSMTEGETWQLVANVVMSEDGSYEGEYKWTSSDATEKVIKLTTDSSSATAEVEAVGAGEATVTLVVGEGREDEKTVSCVISVEERDVYEAVITLEKTSLAKGDSTLASVSFTKNGETYEANGDTEWKSSDENVVTINEDSDGKIVVSAVGVGEAKITVTLAGDEADEIVGEYDITVTAAEARKVSISFEAVSSLLKGSTYDISAVVTMSDGTSEYDGTYTWESSDRSVAAVEENNATASTTVTAIEMGSAKITVTLDNGVTESIDITVIQANVTQITITLEPETMTKGSAAYATANVTLNIDGVEYGGGYTWASSDPDNFVVTGEGKTVTIKAVGTGTFTLTVTLDEGYGGVEAASIEVTIENLVTYTVGDNAGLVAALGSGNESLQIILVDDIEISAECYAAMQTAFLGTKIRSIDFELNGHLLYFCDCLTQTSGPLVFAGGINVTFYGNGGYGEGLLFYPPYNFGFVMKVTDGSTVTVDGVYAVEICRETGGECGLFEVTGSGSCLYLINTYLWSTWDLISPEDGWGDLTDMTICVDERTELSNKRNRSKLS